MLVSLREKGVDLNTQSLYNRLVWDTVSLREKGVDLNTPNCERNQIEQGLPS